MGDVKNATAGGVVIEKSPAAASADRADKGVTPGLDSEPKREGLDIAREHGADLGHGARGLGETPVAAMPVGVMAQAMLAQAAELPKDALELIPGRYPATVSLPSVLKQLHGKPELEGVLQQMLGELQKFSGVQVTRAQIDAVLANPSNILDLVALSPATMSKASDLAQAHHQDKNDEPSVMPQQLPNPTCLDDLGALDVKLPQYEPKEIAPGLLRGSDPSDLPDGEKKTRIVVGEVFNRLAENSIKPKDERFKVQFGGREFTRLETFVEGLREAGYEISVSYEHRVANFAELKVPGPNGQLLDVAAPLMVRTGHTDADGVEAVVPAVHSDMLIHIRSTDKTKGPPLDADLKWYQGIPHTGFKAAGLAKTPAWLGGTHAGSVTGDAAARAIHLAGLFSDSITDIAAQNNLWSNAYLKTGVCNDSVAIIQLLTTGKPTGYPLLMQDEYLLPDLTRRMGLNRNDRGDYAAILEAIAMLQGDFGPSADGASRGVDSLPWPPGEEPFASTEHAREVLNEVRRSPNPGRA